MKKFAIILFAFASFCAMSPIAVATIANGSQNEQPSQIAVAILIAPPEYEKKLETLQESLEKSGFTPQLPQRFSTVWKRGSGMLLPGSGGLERTLI